MAYNKDLRLLAQMTLTQMKQSNRSGIITAKSGYSVDNQDDAEEITSILNNLLSTSSIHNSESSINCKFILGDNCAISFEGNKYIPIAELLSALKTYESQNNLLKQFQTNQQFDPIERIKNIDITMLSTTALSCGNNNDNVEISTSSNTLNKYNDICKQDNVKQVR